jgi:hypothetical protein
MTRVGCAARMCAAIRTSEAAPASARPSLGSAELVWGALAGRLEVGDMNDCAVPVLYLILRFLVDLAVLALPIRRKSLTGARRSGTNPTLSAILQTGQKPQFARFISRTRLHTVRTVPETFLHRVFARGLFRRGHLPTFGLATRHGSGSRDVLMGEYAVSARAVVLLPSGVTAHDLSRSRFSCRYYRHT